MLASGAPSRGKTSSNAYCLGSSGVQRKIILDWEAEAEAEEARQWYADKSPAAATRFVASLRAAMGLVREDPERWVEFERGIRRVMLKKFPYAILYTVRSDHVLVLAVMHFSRHPEYWHGRPRQPPADI